MSIHLSAAEIFIAVIVIPSQHYAIRCLGLFLLIVIITLLVSWATPPPTSINLDIAT